MSSLEDLGFQMLSSRGDTTGAVATTSAGEMWIGGALALGAVFGAAFLRPREVSRQAFDETMDRVSKILRRPRAIVETGADPRLIRLARKGVAAEAIAYGIMGSHNFELERDALDKDIAEIDRLVSKAPPSERMRLMIAYAVNAHHPGMMRHFHWDRSKPLAPSYPKLQLRDAAKVALGVSPKALYAPAPVDESKPSTSARMDFVNATCAARRQEAWSRLSPDDKTILAMRYVAGLHVGEPPPDADPADAWATSIPEAFEILRRRDERHKAHFRRPRRSLVDTVKVLAASPAPVPVMTEISAESLDLGRWEISNCRDDQHLNALMKVRPFARGQGGRYLSNYEIEIEGLAAGVPVDSIKPSQSPESVYKTLESRKVDLSIERFGNRFLYRSPQWWPKVDGLELIRRANLLLEEGSEMNHCLGQVDDVENAIAGKTYFAKITAPDGSRATVQFDARGDVVQFMGPKNTAPSESAERVLETALAEVRRKRES